MNPNKKSILYVLLCVLLWALIPVVSKTGQSDLDNHQFLFWSSLVSMICIGAFLLPKNKQQQIRSLNLKSWMAAIFLGILGTYLYYLLLYFGYANAQGIEVLIIQYCWPVFVTILSVLILKEKLNVWKTLSILLGFSGVILVLSKGQFNNIHLDNLYVDGIVILAAFIFGLFSVLSKKSKTDAVVLVFIYFLTATFLSFGSMMVSSEFKLPTAQSIFPILINGIFVNGISYLLWINALKIGKASFLAPFVFITPVISTLLLLVFFNEPFEPVYLAGMALVIAAGLINREKTKKQKA